MVTVNGVVLLRRDTEANWAYVNPMIADGEAALSTDVKNFKVGPGLWSDLGYWIAGAGINIVEIPFTSTDSGIINWQTDIPTGYTDTYANLLGNYMPQPTIWVLSSGTTYVNAGGGISVDRSGDLINTVTFDFTIGDGFVRF